MNTPKSDFGHNKSLPLLYIKGMVNIMVGFIIGLLVVVLIVVFANAKIVPQGYAYVVEHLGKYKCTWQAGFHVKVPFFERVVRKVSLKEQVLDFPAAPVITKDNVTIMIDSVIYMTVFDPKLYTYGVENPIVGLQNLTASTLRSIIGDMELDQTLSGREEINNRMLKVLDEATDPWGLRLNKCTLKSITPPAEIQEVMINRTSDSYRNDVTNVTENSPRLRTVTNVSLGLA